MGHVNMPISFPRKFQSKPQYRLKRFSKAASMDFGGTGLGIPPYGGKSASFTRQCAGLVERQPLGTGVLHVNHR